MKGGLLNSLSLGFISRAATWHANTQLTNHKTVPFVCREQIYKPNSEIFISESLVCSLGIYNTLQIAFPSTVNTLSGEVQAVSLIIPLVPNKMSICLVSSLQGYSRSVCTSQVSLVWIWKWILVPDSIRVWATQVSSPRVLLIAAALNVRVLLASLGDFASKTQLLLGGRILDWVHLVIKCLVSTYYVQSTIPESEGRLNKRDTNPCLHRDCITVGRWTINKMNKQNSMLEKVSAKEQK